MRNLTIAALLFCFCSRAMAMTDGPVPFLGIITFVIAGIIAIAISNRARRKASENISKYTLDNFRRQQEYENQKKQAEKKRKEDNTFYVSPDGKARKGKNETSE